MSPRERFVPAFVAPPDAEHGSHGCPLARKWERVHGEHCSCRLSAVATGAEPPSIDYAYRRRVLRRRWRVVCDHIPNAARRKVTPEPPPRNAHDPLHALLMANADIAAD